MAFLPHSLFSRSMLVLTGCLLLGLGSANAQVSLTTLGAPSSQNFDTLAVSGTNNPWADNSTIPGWYSTRTTYNAGAGTVNTGALYSFGTGTATERAVGGVASGGTGTIYYAARLVNNTGAALASLDVAYTGEQWRNGGNATAQKLDFQYQVANAGVITDANTPTTGWIDVDTLDFTSPIATTTAGALNGNAVANQVVVSASIPLSAAVGQEIWIRWFDTNDAGNDHGLAVDDLSVTPQDTPPLDLSIDNVTLVEGNAGTTNFMFTVSLSAPAPAGGVSFDIATADGSATVADSDYLAQSLLGQTIAAGSSTFAFTVVVNGDAVLEANETFDVNVSNVSGANPIDALGVGTINNDDAPPDLSIDNVTLVEGNAGTTNFMFTVSLSAPAPAGGVTFDIATADGTATVADNDYVAQSLLGQTIAAGSSTFTFTVVVNGDAVLEANETFDVNISNVSGANPIDALGVGTINNDDAPPDLSIDNVTLVEGNAGTSNFMFTVSLSAPAPAGGVTFDIATADGSATVADSDYVAQSLMSQIIAAGSSTFAFTVVVNGDTNFEANETFFVNVTSVNGANTLDDQGLGTINNDDAGSDLSVAVTVAPDPAMPGDLLTYTVNGNNAGPDAAANAQVDLAFTSNFDGLSPPVGWSCTTPAIGAPGTVSCTIASLPVGGFSFTVTTRVPTSTTPGPLSANASISSATSDPNGANNAAVAAVTIISVTIAPVTIPVVHGPLALLLALASLALGLPLLRRQD